MTKKWSATRSLDGQTKRRASKSVRRTAANEIERWLHEQGATETTTYDEETGAPMRTFTIKLK
jgi:hypothetical protein